MTHQRDGKTGPPVVPAATNLPEKRDRTSDRRVARELYTTYLGAHVLTEQTAFMMAPGATAKDAAMAFIDVLRESLQPRDPFEELLNVQYAWTHARLGKLSIQAANQELTANVRVVNEACDRAANTSRRLMLALAEYRRPPRQDQFVAIKQANVAAQQVVQNHVEHRAKGRKDANEQGCAAPAAVPAVPGGAGGAAGLRLPEPAIAVEHGADVAGGQGAVEPQRDAARGAERADGRGPAGAAGGAAGGRRRRKP